MTDSLLQLSNLTVQYVVQKRIRNAVDNLTLDIPSQRYTLGVVGESGSGKTTLGLSIMNLVKAPGKIVQGEILYKNESVLSMHEDELRKYRWQEVSMVFQSAMNSLNPVKTALDHLTEVLREHHRRVSKQDAREKAYALLSEVGIPHDRASAYSHELSGGMRQRVVIAMALALSPKLLIADEPTSALDVVVQQQILALLRKEVLEKQLSMIFITHEITLLEDLVDFVAVMYAGEVVELGPLDKVLFEPEHPYTEMLLNSLLTLDSEKKSMKANIRSGDSFVIPQVGCRFASRCKYVFDRCRSERPLLKETEKGRMVACHKFN
ncbi:MAG: ABC transporter ATP-binding protein [Thaumarchaeota archaeon]|nr:ABC transporter ATP-binding protein [Nitrososphaerota archaeon]